LISYIRFSSRKRKIISENKGYSFEIFIMECDLSIKLAWSFMLWIVSIIFLIVDYSKLSNLAAHLGIFLYAAIFCSQIIILVHSRDPTYILTFLIFLIGVVSVNRASYKGNNIGIFTLVFMCLTAVCFITCFIIKPYKPQKEKDPEEIIEKKLNFKRKF
jgi:hypothetical protein